MEFGENSERFPLSKLRQFLKCSLCLDFMSSSIYQCPNGHALCSSCKRVVEECPKCREEIGNIKCLALEKIAELLQPHCKYQVFGCPEIIIRNSAMRMHEKTCDFRPYNCPWSEWGCSVVGDIPHLVSHLINYHEDKIVNISEFDFPFLVANIREDQKGPWMVFNCFGEYFYLQGIAYTTRSPSVYMTFLRFMGNPGEASNYGYKLEIERNDGKKFSMEGIPISIRENIVKDEDALIWMQDMTSYCIQTFGRLIEMRQQLQVRGRIWKKPPS